MDNNFDFTSFITKVSNKNFSKSNSDGNTGVSGRRRHQSMPDTETARVGRNSQILGTRTGREFKSLNSYLPVSPTRLERLTKMGSESLNQLGSSSLFQPDRYFKTRGLSVRFDNDAATSSFSMGNSRTKSVYVSPTVIRNAENDDNLVDIYVQRQKTYKETKID